MKKGNIKSLALNKNCISQFQNVIGGRNKDTDDCITARTCSDISCRPGCNITAEPAT